MEYRFINTDNGVSTDPKVERAVARLDKVKSKESITIEAGYKGDHNGYCKITGLKSVINTTGVKVGDAVLDGVRKVEDIVRGAQKTMIDKKQHARRKASKDELGF